MMATIWALPRRLGPVSRCGLRTATKVELVIYKSTDPNAEVDKTIDMTGEDKGVWSATVKKLASGTAYSYKLTFRRWHGQHLFRPVRHRRGRQWRAFRGAVQGGYGIRRQAHAGLRQDH